MLHLRRRARTLSLMSPAMSQSMSTQTSVVTFAEAPQMFSMVTRCHVSGDVYTFHGTLCVTSPTVTCVLLPCRPGRRLCPLPCPRGCLYEHSLLHCRCSWGCTLRHCTWALKTSSRFVHVALDVFADIPRDVHRNTYTLLSSSWIGLHIVWRGSSSYMEFSLPCRWRAVNYEMNNMSTCFCYQKFHKITLYYKNLFLAATHF